MFRAILVIQSSRGSFFKRRNSESQSYEQNNCHVDGLRGDLPSGFSVQLVGWCGKQLHLPYGRALMGSTSVVLKWLLVRNQLLLNFNIFAFS